MRITNNAVMREKIDKKFPVPSNKMSEGTSLDDIESGTIQYEADQAAMHAIMEDMNATESPGLSSVAQMPASLPQMPPMPPMQPMMREPERFAAQYEPVESEPKKIKENFADIPKKNGWSQVFDQSRDALIVGLLVCFFSLPALHTWLGKRLPWAYKVGGSMSWIGFLLLFVAAASSYMAYQMVVKKIGL